MLQPPDGELKSAPLRGYMPNTWIGCYKPHRVVLAAVPFLERGPIEEAGASDSADGPHPPRPPTGLHRTQFKKTKKIKSFFYFLFRFLFSLMNIPHDLDCANALILLRSRRYLSSG